jgi:hypothetical protein
LIEGKEDGLYFFAGKLKKESATIGLSSTLSILIA